jgi:hypothetical protein
LVLLEYVTPSECNGGAIVLGFGGSLAEARRFMMKIKLLESISSRRPQGDSLPPPLVFASQIEEDSPFEKRLAAFRCL